MDLRLLGSVEIRAGGRVLVIDRPQQRVVLAVLAAGVGRPVPVDTLVDRVWGQEPPERARRMLHTHIARLRKLLERARAADGDAASVQRRGESYLLDVPPECLDLNRFRGLVSRAGEAGRAAERAALLREALELWRGEPLAGLSGAWVEQIRQVWLQQRLHAVLEWADAELEAGDEVRVIERLIPELAEHPLVEPLVVALMRALYSAGRGAEALHHYESARKRLAEDLGADPSPQLQAVHQAILRGERDTAPATVARRRAAVPPPAQLPADIAGFTGREAELDRLDRQLSGAGAVTVCAISGMAGVGKTSLAIHWAHRVSGHFPDGQLYIDLRGYDPEQPVAADDALARFLAALGVTGEDLPSELDDRAARFRTEAAGRRMLILLDNASSVEQIRPLLPGTGPCAVLVTSRDSLAAMVALHGADRIELDVLSAAEADTLIRRQMGARQDAGPEVVAALVERCARLPLALRVAAELVMSRPKTPLTDLVNDLADEQQRLDLLDTGDPRAAVTAAFSWSLRYLPRAAVHTFALLGIHPGPDIDTHAAAALAGTPPAEARRTLTRLSRAHLIQPTNDDRYGMHDLLRAYATGLVCTQIPEPDRKAAAGRLVDHYLTTAIAAANLLHPDKPTEDLATWRSAPTVELDSPEAALAWLDTQRANLTAMAGYAATHGWPHHAVRLSVALSRYLDGGYQSDAVAVHAHAYRAAQLSTDHSAQAHAARLLADAYLGIRRPGTAVEYHLEALAMFRRLGDVAGEAAAVNGLGKAEQQSGRYGRAVAYHQDAMALHVRLGDHAGQGRTLNKLGAAAVRRGRFRSAATYFRQAITAFRLAGNQVGEAIALNNLGLAELRTGHLRTATTHIEQGLSLCRRLGNLHGEAGALDNLGSVHTGLRRPRIAAELHRKALALFTTIGERDGQASALNGLGEAAFAAGQTVEAMAHHRAALATATDAAILDEQARAHAGLGHALRSLAQPAEARRHYEHALALYPDADAPQARRIRLALAETPG